MHERLGDSKGMAGYRDAEGMGIGYGTTGRRCYRALDALSKMHQSTRSRKLARALNAA